MKSLSEIIGHERAKAVLAASARSGRVHHAWIFHGPEGVGKRTLAEAFALALLDETTRVEGDRLVSDPDSPTRRLAASGAHPDLHVVTKELARFSDDPDIRKRKLTTIPREVLVERVIEPASRSASVRRQSLASKAFIVDEAELMNDAGQNALLKTLEEPAPGTVLMLVTSSEERLLPTIRSRSQRVALGPLSDGEMRAWAKAEGFASERAMALSGGRPGVAVQAAAGGFDRWLEELEPMLRDAERGKYSAALGPRLKELVDEWARAQVDASENASKDAANKAGARALLGLLAERVRRSVRALSAEGIEARRDDLERRVRELELIGEAEVHVARNVNLQLAMENLSAQLCASGSR